MARKSMTEKDIGKGNMLLTYLFAENAQLKDCYCINCDSEKVMKAELQELAEQWKKRGLIRKYVIADDELINDKLTTVEGKKTYQSLINLIPNEELKDSLLITYSYLFKEG